MPDTTEMTPEQKLNYIIEQQAETITELENGVTSAMNKHYKVNHDVYVSESLEECYSRIIAENPELANVSAVGMRIALNLGDKLPVFNHRLFINGTEETQYTLTGTFYECLYQQSQPTDWNEHPEKYYRYESNEFVQLTTETQGQYAPNVYYKAVTSAYPEVGNEIVNVWLFTQDSTFNLCNPTEFFIPEISIKQKSQIVNIHCSYVENPYILSVDGFNNFDTVCGEYRKQYTTSSHVWRNGIICAQTNAKIVKILNNGNIKFISTKVSKIICDFETISQPILGSTNCESGGTGELLYPIIEIDLTNVKNLSGEKLFYGFHLGNIKMPNVEHLTGTTRVVPGYYGLAPFQTPETLVLPKSLKTISGLAVSYYMSDDAHLYDRLEERLILQCCELQSVSDNWCYSSPNILIIDCREGEWNSTINLAGAGGRMTELSFWTDIIENKLKDLTDETAKMLKVPTTIFNQLNADDSCPLEYEEKIDGSWVEYAATVKGWTIGAA